MSTSGMDARESVVLVNGLWFGDVTLIPLARRLRHAGFHVHSFSYPSVRFDLHTNAQRLQAFLERVPGDTVHFVAFSLGGLVLRALFHYYPEQRPGRVVLLGSPQQGSIVAGQMMRSPVGRLVGGRSLSDLVAGHPRRWRWPDREIGVIAGSRALGLGRLVMRLPDAASDGSVLVEETDVPGARDRLVLPVAHSGLLVSAQVGDQIVRFLRFGRFTHHAA